MRASRRRRVLIGAAAAVPSALAVSSPATAAAARPTAPPPRQEPSPEYCSTLALTPEQLDAGALSTVTCYPTYEESLRAIGAEPLATSGAGASADEVADGDGVIALHFENPSGDGSPLTIGGSSCNGGGVSFPVGSAWNDRIRATAPRGCSTVKHWTEPDYSGPTDTVTGSGTRSLSGALAGRVSSIRYYA